MSPDTKQLFRYLDGEMSPEEAERFRTLVSESPELQCRLAQLAEVGAAVRGWAAAAEARAGDLLAPTLERVREAQRRRARTATLGYVLAAALIVALPWSRRAPELGSLPAPRPASSAAIERVEATDRQAQVFVVGSSSTPVVWLADDAQDEDAGQDQDPG